MAAPVGPNVTITFPEKEFIALLQPFVKEINELRARVSELETKLISSEELLWSTMQDVDLLIQYHDAQKDDGR